MSGENAERESSDDKLTVVGVGASAGGLEALKDFVEAISVDTEYAFVLITHQQAGQVTLLPQLLAPHTSLRIASVSDGLALERGVLYIAPPDAIALDGRVIRAVPAVDGQFRHHPIDAFFVSLAALKEDAVAVVLSGTGSDGTRGVAEVGAAGGLVLVQDAQSARFPQMPASAAASSFVDAVLPPQEIPPKIEDLQARRARHTRSISASEDATAALMRVLHLLRARTGQDFTAYKKSTLWRRVERRMNVQGVSTPQEYARVLESRPEEIEVLFRELLISVTSFFRDPETFVSLKAHLKSSFEARDDDRPFRAWVPACATGEEAYSLAIVVREFLDELNRHVPVQIFATDLDQPAIEAARAGRYPFGIEDQVGPERLERFFVKTDAGYRISKEIRESIIFAPQNVIKDPPFTRLDLVSCRNLLIYLEPELQRRVISLFSYALQADGLLLLGSSESIAGFDHAFFALDKKNKLFRRGENRVDMPAEFPEVPSAPALLRSHRSKAEPGRGSTAIGAVAERVVLTNLAPPSVLVNDRGDIAYFHGRTGNFLEPAAGEPVTNIFGMVREGLRIDLTLALRQAGRGQPVVVRPGLRVKNNGGFMRVRLSVRRLDEPALVRGMFLVSFEQEPDVDPSEENSGSGEQSAQVNRVGELELELQHTRDNLRATIEELETSNEELKSTNEELQSTNEELQSANEELETSREEMQSLNEELQTVNSELEERNRALSQANDDMQNLLNSTDVATVFLDDKLAIQRFTTQARKVFSLIDTDIGRPISDLSANLRYDDLVSDAREVLRSLVFQEREILTKEGAWRMMRIMPYRTAENVIDGLVMTFIDIDRIKREQHSADEARRFAEALVEALPAGVAVLDAELRVVTANQSLYKTFKTNAKRALGEPIQSFDALLDVPEFVDRLRDVVNGSIELSKFDLPPTGTRLGNRGLTVSARRMLMASGAPVMALVVIEEKTAED